jgi:hypothetical protein
MHRRWLHGASPSPPAPGSGASTGCRTRRGHPRPRTHRRLPIQDVSPSPPAPRVSAAAVGCILQDASPLPPSKDVSRAEQTCELNGEMPEVLRFCQRQRRGRAASSRGDPLLRPAVVESLPPSPPVESPPPSSPVESPPPPLWREPRGNVCFILVARDAIHGSALVFLKTG